MSNSITQPQAIRDDPRTAASGWLRPLCKRCAAIPWPKFLNQNQNANDKLQPAFEEAAKELNNSPCRVCQLFSFIKAFGWLDYIGYEPASPGSSFSGKLRFFPGENAKVPKAATPDLFGYVGIIENLEQNLPLPRPAPEYVDIGLVQQWMTECKATHQDPCTPDDPSLLYNFQVIDCEARAITLAPMACAYVALSYVWGPPSNDDVEYVFPTLPARLPLTIEDAITVTKRLGLRYIWVDRYCINQNDPDDTMRQILQMGAIYSSAQLTIIAASGAGPQHGLPGVSHPRKIPSPYSEVVGSVALVLTSIGAVQDVFESAWASRAWTFQEGYLSRRRLFFTDRTMLFICNKDLRGDIATDYTLGEIHERRTAQQFLSLEAPMPAMDDFVVQSKTMTLAGRQLKAFSRRRLTYDSDSLNAILGILDQLAKNQADQSDHVWGVPLALYPREYADNSSSRLVSYEVALNWYHEEPCRRRVGFPSWSSIGWDGPIEYSYQDQPMVPDDIDVQVLSGERSETLESYMTSGLARKHSGLKEAPGLLKLSQARTIPIELADIDGYIRAILKLSNDLDIYQYVLWDETVPAKTPGLIGVIIYRDLQLGRLIMLVLTPRKDHYERIGFILFDEDEIRFRKLGEGLVRVRSSGETVRDLQYLKERLERPVRLIDEEKQDLVFG
jgi:hypothetical protein